MREKPFGNRPMTIDELGFILSTTHGDWKVFVGDNTRVPYNLRCEGNFVFLSLTETLTDGLRVYELWERVDQEVEAMRGSPDDIAPVIDMREVFADPKGTVAVVDVKLDRDNKSILLVTKE